MEGQALASRVKCEVKPAPVKQEFNSKVNYKELCVSLKERVEVHIKQEGIPSQIPVELCYLGWQESLEQLAKLVEPEIRD